MKFGFAEYSRIHEVYQCYKVLNGQELLGSTLIAKLDVKGMEFMQKWKDSKVADFCELNPDADREALEGLSIESHDGGKSMNTFEKSLFENYTGVIRLFAETVEKKDLIEQVAKEHAQQKEEQKRIQALTGMGKGDSIYMDADPLMRHKETAREIQRAEKIYKFNKEREDRCKKRIKEWQEHEKAIRE